MPFSVFLLIYIVNKVALRSPINKRTYPTIDGRCINKRIQITEYQVFLFSFFFLRNYGGGFLKVRSTVDGTSTLLPRQSTPRALSLSLSLSLSRPLYIAATNSLVAFSTRLLHFTPHQAEGFQTQLLKPR